MPNELSFADYIGIKRAFRSYCRAIDDADWALLADAFAIDAKWVQADGTTHEGLPAIVGMLEESASSLPYRSLHVLANEDFEFDGRAVVSTSNWLYFVRDTPENGPTGALAVRGPWQLGSAGTYDDRLERIDGRWLLTYRRISNWEFEESPIERLRIAERTGT